MIPIFIGYDPNESVAFHTCSSSIIRNTSEPVAIIPLALNLLNNYKEVHNDGSNTFTYTRFLVPYLTKYFGHAIFLDGDMLVLDDIVNLWNMRSNNYAVQVVKHNYKTKSKIKYLNNHNADYPKKNWSSVMIWNCSHAKNKFLTPISIAESTGEILHRFTWLNEDEVGDLPLEWNWLSDEYGTNEDAKLIHYTLGIPDFKQFSNVVYSDLWEKEKIFVNYCKQYD
jgi:lipopolysaccharide biosynthesis glycosyltransferase